MPSQDIWAIVAQVAIALVASGVAVKLTMLWHDRRAIGRPPSALRLMWRREPLLVISMAFCAVTIVVGLAAGRWVGPLFGALAISGVLLARRSVSPVRHGTAEIVGITPSKDFVPPVMRLDIPAPVDLARDPVAADQFLRYQRDALGLSATGTLSSQPTGVGSLMQPTEKVYALPTDERGKATVFDYPGGKHRAGRGPDALGPVARMILEKAAKAEEADKFLEEARRQGFGPHGVGCQCVAYEEVHELGSYEPVDTLVPPCCHPERHEVVSDGHLVAWICKTCPADGHYPFPYQERP